MTKTEQTELILAHIGEELRMQDDVVERVERSFEEWFQQLTAPMEGMPNEEETEE